MHRYLKTDKISRKFEILGGFFNQMPKYVVVVSYKMPKYVIYLPKSVNLGGKKNVLGFYLGFPSLVMSFHWRLMWNLLN